MREGVGLRFAATDDADPTLRVLQYAKDAGQQQSPARARRGTQNRSPVPARAHVLERAQATVLNHARGPLARAADPESAEHCKARLGLAGSQADSDSRAAASLARPGRCDRGRVEGPNRCSRHCIISERQGPRPTTARGAGALRVRPSSRVSESGDAGGTASGPARAHSAWRPHRGHRACVRGIRPRRRCLCTCRVGAGRGRCAQRSRSTSSARVVTPSPTPRRRIGRSTVPRDRLDPQPRGPDLPVCVCARALPGRPAPPVSPPFS
jgi:hypothetical protein